MKVEAVDDPSGQVGFYTAQRSDIIAKMDEEIIKAIAEIEEKYAAQIKEIDDLIESTRSLLT